MTALYRAGRQSEALDWFHRTRRLLVDELGVDPGRELAQAYALILRGDQVQQGGPDTSADPVAAPAAGIPDGAAARPPSPAGTRPDPERRDMNRQDRDRRDAKGPVVRAPPDIMAPDGKKWCTGRPYCKGSRIKSPCVKGRESSPGRTVHARSPRPQTARTTRRLVSSGGAWRP